eukprot:bmy_09875T0
MCLDEHRSGRSNRSLHVWFAFNPGPRDAPAPPVYLVSCRRPTLPLPQLRPRGPGGEAGLCHRGERRALDKSTGASFTKSQDVRKEILFTSLFFHGSISGAEIGQLQNRIGSAVIGSHRGKRVFEHKIYHAFFGKQGTLVLPHLLDILFVRLGVTLEGGVPVTAAEWLT